MDPQNYNPRDLEMTTVQAVAVELGSADDETAPGYKPPFMRQTSERVEAHFERRTSLMRQTSQRMDTHNPCSSTVSCSALCGFGFFGYFMVMLYMAAVLYPEQEFNCPGKCIQRKCHEGPLNRVTEAIDLCSRDEWQDQTSCKLKYCREDALLAGELNDKQIPFAESCLEQIVNDGQFLRDVAALEGFNGVCKSKSHKGGLLCRENCSRCSLWEDYVPAVLTMTFVQGALLISAVFASACFEPSSGIWPLGLFMILTSAVWICSIITFKLEMDPNFQTGPDDCGFGWFDEEKSDMFVNLLIMQISMGSLFAPFFFCGGKWESFLRRHP